VSLASCPSSPSALPLVSLLESQAALPKNGRVARAGKGGASFLRRFPRRDPNLSVIQPFKAVVQVCRLALPRESGAAERGHGEGNIVGWRPAHEWAL